MSTNYIIKKTRYNFALFCKIFRTGCQAVDLKCIGRWCVLIY